MREKLDLLIIRPGDKKNIYGDLSFNLAAVEPPLWAGLIAAYVREQGYTVRLLDVEAENWNIAEAVDKLSILNPTLTAIFVTGSNLSASTWKMHGAGQLARKIKADNPNQKIIFWGLHPSAVPEKTLLEESADFICRGEGFTTFSELLDHLSRDQSSRFENIPGLCFRINGRAVVQPHPPVVRILDDLPMPAWDLMPMKKYRAHNWHCFDDIDKRQPYGVIYTSLGCPYRCSFCALKTLFGGAGIRYRSPENVVSEIDFLVDRFGIRNIKILDECFTIQKAHTERICDLIIEKSHDLNMWAYARVDTVDERLLGKMRQAGLSWLCYGIESGSDRILAQISKGRYNRQKVKEVVAMTKAAGINILANFMFGLPDDDFDSMQETLEFAKELNCEYTNFYTTMAYPGSDLYRDALENKLRLPDTWLGYSQFSRDTLPLATRHLSSSDILRFRDDAFLKYHRDPVYLDMVRHRFGQRVARHIKGITQHRIPRKFA